MLLHSKIIGDSDNHVLILHGFLGSGDNWISIARKLNIEGFTVHLIDQRNHGRSFHSDNFTTSSGVVTVTTVDGGSF